MGMPDLKQQGFGKLLPRSGFAYCGPTAAANVLLWMDNHRMSEVASEGHSSRLVRERVRTFDVSDAGNLIRTLGQYMETDSKDGTPPKNLVGGLARYLKDQGQSDWCLTYHGIRPVARQFHTRNGPPSISHLRQSVQQGTFALLNVGWYRRQGDTLVRVGGHWVTFAGWQNRGGQTHLVVHDPANRPYWKPSNLLLRLQPLGAGKLRDNKDGWAHEARGFCRLLGPIDRARGSDFAVLEGAVFIEPGGKRIARR